MASRPNYPTTPRPWAVMLDAWTEHVHELFGITGGYNASVETGPAETDLHTRTWRWMWSLPPCSEARKAAFTAGVAARSIERWRRIDAGVPGLSLTSEELAKRSPEGHRAEQLLRILAWHVDDAKGEAAALRYHAASAPTIPPHERVYERRPDGRVARQGQVIDVGLSPSLGVLAFAILSDHRAHRPDDRKRINLLIAFDTTVGEASTIARGFEQSFEALCIASLPDFWVMTSTDVSRFLDLILEEQAPTGETPVSWKQPGPWVRATHVTCGGDLEIRERSDGRYDVRAVGVQPLGWPLADQVAERGVDAAYVRAEIKVLP